MSEPVFYPYRAFISYSHADKAWCDWLHKGLESFSIPRDLRGRLTAAGPVPRHLRPVFRDRSDFSAGPLQEQTVAALKDSQFLIVLASPNSARSTYVNEEIRLFKSFGGGDRVLPLIVEGKPPECFAPDLNETVAGDVNKDGKREALVKIVAGLTGLPYDILWMRDVKAHRMRMAGLAAAGVAAMAGVGFGVEHFVETKPRIERHDQQIEKLTVAVLALGRAQTEPAQDKAVAAAIADIVQGARAGDTRLRKAEDLLNAGKLEEATALLEEEARQEEAAGKQHNKNAAGAYRRQGAIAGLRDPRRSREAYARALDLNPGDTESLYWNGFLSLLAGDLNVSEHFLNQLMAESVNTNSRRGLYRAHLRLGEVSMARGDLAGSIEHQKKAMAIAESAATNEPANAEWQGDYSVSLEKIGDVLLAQGNLSGALESYKTSLAIRERFATTTDPQNTGWQRDLSVSHNKIGDVFRAQDNLPAALESYMASFTIRERLARASPGNAGAQRDLSVSQEKIGNVLLAQRKFAAALEHYIGSLNIRRRLANADDKNAGWQHDVSVSLENIGDVLLAQGNLSGALESYEASLAIRERLATTDPQNAGWQRNLSVSHNKIGDVFRAQDNLPAVLESYMASFTIRERLAKASPGNAGWQADFAMIHADLGQFHAALGNNAEALRLFKAGREILAPVAQRSGNMRWVRQVRKFDRDIVTLQK